MRRVLIAVVGLLVVGVLPAAARRHCPGGRFVAEDGSLAVILEGRRVSVAETCPAVRAQTRSSRRGLSVKAAWPCCADGVRLKARVERNCWRMTGFVRMGKLRRPFIAIREPTCGNGMREGEEQCDGDSCCDAECRSIDACSQSCRSIYDCPRGTVCAKRAGDCEGEGVCRQPPAACEGLLEPVCSCDGRTYVNACEAARAGKTVRADGQCGARCGTIAGIVCPPGQVCEFPSGTCGVADLEGVCVPAPAGCPSGGQPVCGCDGVTYRNECQRRASGVAKKHDGACDCPVILCEPGTNPHDTDADGCPDRCAECIENDDCGPGQFCDGDCGGPGACVRRADGCLAVYDPVCGCDGMTYSNRCEASRAGVRVSHPERCPCFPILCSPDTRPVDRDGDGCMDDCRVPCEDTCDCYGKSLVADPCPAPCPTCGSYWLCDEGFCKSACGPVPPGQAACPVPQVCDTDDDCGRDEFCAKREPGCGGSGLCTRRPVLCRDIDAPVCGCDGQAYGNACVAASRSVNVASDGPCPGQCGTIVGIPCHERQFCDFPPGMCGGADLAGFCADVPVVCPDLTRPVCGCDGETYQNDCGRRSAMAQKAHDGACR